MIEFTFTARDPEPYSFGDSAGMQERICSSLFPFDFKAECKTKKNNYQLTSYFDDAFTQKAEASRLPLASIALPRGVTKEYDFALNIDGAIVVFEVEKANWEKFLYDFLKAHIYIKRGAEYCCIVLPRNWAHSNGVKDVFDESRKRLMLAQEFGHGSPEVFAKLILVGFRQHWNGRPFSQAAREEIRNLSKAAFAEAEQ